MRDSRKTDEIRFGYWSRGFELHSGSAMIRPVHNHDDIVKLMTHNERVANGWLYPPLVPADDRRIASEKRPRIYKRVFELDSTHCLIVARTSKSRLLGEFLIGLLGMLEGLRLVPEGWNHFYRAAIEPHSLSDVHCTRRDLERVLENAQVFWRKTTAEVRRLMFGAIHWRLFSESYEYEFERFSGQYTVLDTCWKIFNLLEPEWVSNYVGLRDIPKWARSLRNRNPKRVAHAFRPALLAKRYEMRFPSWARLRKDNSCRLSELRNRLIHEGLYGNKPIGFAYPKNFKGSIDLQLREFNTRAILAIIGVKCGYIQSSVETRCRFELDLNPRRT